MYPIFEIMGRKKKFGLFPSESLLKKQTIGTIREGHKFKESKKNLK